ncbi:hypothetical protein [Streptomyces sp. NPDC048001]|uniref:hypothetical protein n=1 Tax=Streptomyces sp. NPDC048001 TaxID=3365498 RepID=UPI003723F071
MALAAALLVSARRYVLGLAIFVFTISGLTSLMLSAFVFTGWWGDFLINLGLGLVFSGVVDLMILGVIGDLRQRDQKDSRQIHVTLDRGGSDELSSLIALALESRLDIVIRVPERSTE